MIHVDWAGKPFPGILREIAMLEDAVDEVLAYEARGIAANVVLQPCDLAWLLPKGTAVEVAPGVYMDRKRRVTLKVRPDDPPP